MQRHEGSKAGFASSGVYSRDSGSGDPIEQNGYKQGARDAYASSTHRPDVSDPTDPRYDAGSTDPRYDAGHMQYGSSVQEYDAAHQQLHAQPYDAGQADPRYDDAVCDRDERGGMQDRSMQDRSMQDGSMQDGSMQDGSMFEAGGGVAMTRGRAGSSSIIDVIRGAKREARKGTGQDFDPYLDMSERQMEKEAKEAKEAKEVEEAKDAQTPKVDEKVLQQLRGIFMTHDADRDLHLDPSQLAAAIRALGFSPTEALLAKFMLRRPVRHGRLIDLQTFVTVSTEELQQERKCSGDVLELFGLFDDDKSGTISAGSLRHILHETLTPERLTRAEVRCGDAVVLLYLCMCS
jgi:Ca2+-binding EF-hand superfamily protein